MIRLSDDNLFKVSNIISSTIIFENPVYLEYAFGEIDNHPNFKIV